MRSTSSNNGAKILKIREIRRGAKEQNVKLEKTLKNEALDSNIGVDTAENEPRKGSENRVLEMTPLVIRGGGA